MTVIVRAEVLQQVVDQLADGGRRGDLPDRLRRAVGRAVDPANVGMVELEVEPGAFESVGDRGCSRSG